MGMPAFLEIQRCPLLQVVGKEGLTEEGIPAGKTSGEQENFLNKVVLEEAASVYAKCRDGEEKHRKPEVPFLLFCSDGKELGGFWVPLQKKYAERLNCELIQYACGHYLHHYKAGEMAETIRPFVEKSGNREWHKNKAPAGALSMFLYSVSENLFPVFI